MTVTTPRAGGPATRPHMSFLRTVDRSLLHRWALSEVFLTDCRRTDATGYLAAALLPPAHVYYTDHMLPQPLPDALLVLECCRQAETYGGHAFFGVDRNTAFILKRWSVRLDGLVDLPPARRPLELSMAVRTHSAKGRPPRLRGLTYEVSANAAGTALGTVSIDVGYLPKDVYQQLRADRRGGPPVRSDAYVGDRPGTPVAGHRVGRANPDNVLLVDAVAGPGEVAATVRPPVDHPSMFDHPQDHLPGMVLTEAARQVALLALDEWYCLSPTRMALVGVEASFAAYAEIDVPTVVRARRQATEHMAPGSPSPSVRVGVEQDGTETAAMTLRFAPVGVSGVGVPS